jgi:hypothetical protein
MYTYCYSKYTNYTPVAFACDLRFLHAAWSRVVSRSSCVRKESCCAHALAQCLLQEQTRQSIDIDSSNPRHLGTVLLLPSLYCTIIVVDSCFYESIKSKHDE